MTTIRYNHIRFMPLLFLAAVVLFLSACEENEIGPPVITDVRNYAATPDDTVIQSLNTGQWVVVLGKNLSSVTQVLFGSTLATTNHTLFTDESIVVQVPEIPFSLVPADRVNEITVFSEGGMATYTIEIVGAPIISHVRNHEASPNDTIVDVIFPGQQINLVGYNLKDATEITFQGVAVDLANVEYSDTSAVVQVPDDLSGSDDELVDMISYTNRVGTGTYTIKILGPPIVTSISNENPNEGDVVRVFGNNFVSVESITFAGASVSSFDVAANGSSIELTVPALSESGPLVVTTPAGSFTTLYNVNDQTTGVLCNFDDISPIGWGGSGATVDDDPTAFPGNKGSYAILQNDQLAPWDWQAWNGGRIAILDSVTWVPEANVSDPLNNWAVKFEIYVADDWNGGTLFISSEHNDYRAFYEPWKGAGGTTAPYSTDGWRTVSFPLSAFYKGWGGDEAAASIADLIGDTGVSAIAIQTMNIGSQTTATGLNAAIDNIRVVKIR